MKKYTAVLTLLMVFAAFSAFSQAGDPKKIWTVPSAYTLDEPVTIYIDLEGTVIAGEKEVYMWGWSNGYSLENGAWDASDPARQWNKDEGSTVAYKTFNKITDVWPEASLKSTVNFLLKAKNGNGDLKTNDISLTIPDWTEATNNILTTIPADFEGTDNVSILVNVAQAYNDGGSAQGELVGVAQVAAHSGVNGWSNVVESTEDKAHLTHLGDNIWRLDMVPAEFYGFTDEPVTEINMLFNNDGDWSASGRDEGGANFLISVEEPASNKVRLAFSTFPASFTANDIVTFYFDTNLIGGRFAYVDELKMEAPEFDGIVADMPEEEMVLRNVGGGYYSLTVSPKTLFNLTSAEVEAGGKVKIILKADEETTSTFEFDVAACQ